MFYKTCLDLPFFYLIDFKLVFYVSFYSHVIENYRSYIWS